MYPELERNIPGNPNWEGSFYERLTEYGEWDTESFWALSLELLNIAKVVDTNLPADRNLSFMLVFLQQRVLNLISAHFNTSDIFEIRNIQPDLLYAFKERFEMAIVAAISGEWRPESSFDVMNPLVEDS